MITFNNEDNSNTSINRMLDKKERQSERSLLLPNNNNTSIYIDPKELISVQLIAREQDHERDMQLNQPMFKKTTFSIIFQLLFAIIAFLLAPIPSKKIHVDEDTYIFCESAFILFYLMVILGYFYVRTVTCNQGWSFIKDRNGSFQVCFCL